MRDDNGTLTINTRLTVGVVLIIVAIVGSAAAIQFQTAANGKDIAGIEAQIKALPDKYVPRREIERMGEDVREIKADVKALRENSRSEVDNGKYK